MSILGISAKIFPVSDDNLWETTITYVMYQHKLHFPESSASEVLQTQSEGRSYRGAAGALTTLYGYGFLPPPQNCGSMEYNFI